MERITVLTNCHLFGAIGIQFHGCEPVAYDIIEIIDYSDDIVFHVFNQTGKLMASIVTVRNLDD